MDQINLLHFIQTNLRTFPSELMLPFPFVCCPGVQTTPSSFFSKPVIGMLRENNV